MNIVQYLKEKMAFIIARLLVYFFILWILYVFQVSVVFIIIIFIALILMDLAFLIFDYSKKYRYYKTVLDTLENLDKKFLLPELISDGDFEDGRMVYEILKVTNKSMHEEVNKYKFLQEEYKEYIEMWVHEVKTPIASSKLIIENNKNEVTLSLLEEIEKIEKFIEQVLYYSRSNNVEKDYIVRELNLIDSVNKVIKKNKKDLRGKRFFIDVDKSVNVNVFSDTKWIEFILNQVIANAIKYSKDTNRSLKFYTKENENNIILSIEDNGIGIDEKELLKVFDKGFTGNNGRNEEKSTGMGLYLTKKLCDKLSLGINIESKVNYGTVVSLSFPKNKFILMES